MVKITDILPDSIASSVGIKKNDFLVSINGFEINDVLDYRFYLTEEEIEIEILRGESKLLFDIEKEQYDDIGLDFETPLMDKKHSCRNKCIFCFIDQLPKGLRDTLYFKDDDSRLSFLHGNYITLTNLSKPDIDRIIKMHISPVNVSIHTTNPELRCQMMNNRFAGEALEYLKALAKSGIKINAQIVACRDINDGKELERTLNDLAELYPSLSSVAVVPSGLTKFREGLYPLKGYDKSSSLAVIDLVEKLSAKYSKKFGKNIFFASDEFYLMAERELPSDEYYEEYSQLDNGVGMLRSFECEALSFLKMLTDEEKEFSRNISIATGESAYDFISKIVKCVQKHCKNLKCNVYKIENDFFGHTITVSGLITGVDLVNQLNGKELGDELLISRSMLRSEGDLFLCGTSLEELENKLGVKVTPIEQDGACFVEGLLGIGG
jgi:putative radical SAM enzyme (TIGR03279 family)